MCNNRLLPPTPSCVCGSRAVAVLYAVALLCLAAIFCLSCGYDYTYGPYSVSDWLINYQAGFVRRGLCGEILWQVWQVCPFPPKTVIVFIELLSFVLFAVKSARVCRRLGMSLLPLALIVVGTCWSLCWVRRDWLVLWLVAYVFEWHVAWLRDGRWRHWVAAQGVLAVLMLMHEATFFFTVPIMAAVMWLHDNSRRHFVSKALRVTAAFLPTLVAFAATVLCSGSGETGEAIWRSWTPAFTLYPEASGALPELGAGVGIMSWSLAKIVAFHINSNFEPSESLQHVLYVVVSWFALLASTCYLLFTNPRATLRPFAATPAFRPMLGNIVVFQTVVMLPMLTVLSCDFGRTMMYIAASSLFACYAVRSKRLSINRPQWLPNIAARCSRWSILTSPWLYLVVAVLYPIHGCFSIRLGTSNMLTAVWNVLCGTINY